MILKTARTNDNEEVQPEAYTTSDDSWCVGWLENRIMKVIRERGRNLLHPLC